MARHHRYVGRIVRLNQEVFRGLSRRAERQGRTLENCFIVAEAHPEMRQLICYGANFRVAVGIAEVSLI